MKLDRKGIRFNLWLFYLLFAIAIVVMLGFLQVLLIKPYYRNTKKETVRHVLDKIETYVIEQNTPNTMDQAFQVSVDNNVCVAVYNDAGHLVYDADSLGSGCVFNAPSSITKKTDLNFQDGMALKEFVDESSGECSIDVLNTKTNQEMIVYGKKIEANLGNYYIYVNSPLEPIDSIVSFYTNQYFIYTLIVMVAASLISIFLSNSLTKPIVLMQQEANKLAKADYSAKFDGGSFTETKELAKTLNESNEKLSKIEELRKDLIANVSHDIKTPLTSIKAYAEMIIDISGENKEMREEHLRVIIDEANYLDHLVNDMSELSKMQSGNYVLQCCNFDLTTTVKQVLSLNQVLIEQGGLQVVLELEEDVYVYGDPIKLKQVIYNYLSNAIKHTAKGKSITLRLFHVNEDCVRFEVLDEGEGIAKEDLPYIWDRYQKSSRSFSRSLTSTGLGLSIVKAILDTHHARYGVLSKVGEGSLFYFELDRNELEDMDAN